MSERRERCASRAAAFAGLALLGSCGRCSSVSDDAPLSAYPRCEAVTAVRLPTKTQGRWGVTLATSSDEVLRRHEPKLRKLGIEPNGEAWAGILEQCLARDELRGVTLDPEAGSLHAWVATDADKDRWVAVLCRAVEHPTWLEGCLATVDRKRIDD